jgi:flagellar biosynthesis/type III secretory pathway protein FliH
MVSLLIMSFKFHIPQLETFSLQKVRFSDEEKRLKMAYQKGLEAGRQSMESFYNMQIIEYRKELATLHEHWSQNLKAHITQMETVFQQELPDMIVAVIQKVWSYLEWDANAVKAMIHEALVDYHPEEGDVEVYLSAPDIELFREMGVELQYPGIAFKEDLNLKKGDCYVKGKFGLQDHRLETKLKPLRENLKVSVN